MYAVFIPSSSSPLPAGPSGNGVYNSYDSLLNAFVTVQRRMLICLPPSFLPTCYLFLPSFLPAYITSSFILPPHTSLAVPVTHVVLLFTVWLFSNSEALFPVFLPSFLPSCLPSWLFIISIPSLSLSLSSILTLSNVFFYDLHSSSFL